MANETVPFVSEIFAKPVPAWEFDLIVGLIFGLTNNTAEAVVATYGAPPAAQKHDCRPHVNQLGTDYLFYCANRYVLARLADNAPVFHWFFDHLPSYSTWIYEVSTEQIGGAATRSDRVRPKVHRARGRALKSPPPSHATKCAPSPCPHIRESRT